MNHLKSLVLVLVGVTLGWLAAMLWAGDRESVPEDWLARVGDEYITTDDFLDEVERRGGSRTGLYVDPERRQSLLEDMLYRRSVVAAARVEGMDADRDLRRLRDQHLVNHYYQNHLRPRQETLHIDQSEVEAFFHAHADEYVIPGRRRVALIRIDVPEDAPPEVRQERRARAEQARQRALELNGPVLHFGTLALEYSEDPGSRYRNGVIGWIGEQAPERYRFDPIVVSVANRMDTPGDISPVLEGKNAYYLVRLVEYQPERTRALDELADGIRQRLMRERFQAVEQEFRDEMLAAFDIEIDTGKLAAVEVPGPAERPTERRPPSVTDQP
jgi:hypothetical protein